MLYIRAWEGVLSSDCTFCLRCLQVLKTGTFLNEQFIVEKIGLEENADIKFFSSVFVSGFTFRRLL
jgi:hypothetical protein